ncbi:c-type cytochrome [Marinimicrobium alkaliphilum]|uniref:c-type cytochrome n=1 Tax=Marinimicrobium alkaliphilum TaxID=2202654 RepID=UPI000DBA2AE6|nr:c-type cytochrome [Marinimicrobium alkaliphilum]
MKKLVTRVLFSLGMVALAQGAMAGDPQAGADKVAVCAACHSDDGNSPSSAFPKIAGLGEKYLLKQLRDIQTWDQEQQQNIARPAGRAVPQMTGMLRNLSDQDLKDMAAFYAQYEMQTSGAREFDVQIYTGDMVDSLELGERIWRAGNLETGVPACTGCHAPSGMGNDPAGFPRLAGQYAEYIEQQLRAFRAGDRRNDGEEMMMRGTARNMSDAEIRAVANFISGLQK